MLDGLVADDMRWALREALDAAAEDGSPGAEGEDVVTCGTSPVDDADGICDRPFC